MTDLARFHSLACGLLNDDPRGCTCQPDAPAVLAAERAERRRPTVMSQIERAIALLSGPSPKVEEAISALRVSKVIAQRTLKSVGYAR